VDLNETGFDVNSFGNKSCEKSLSLNRKHFILMEIRSSSTVGPDALNAWTLVEKKSELGTENRLLHCIFVFVCTVSIR
jgi:hypothetical protein